jgi:hypothetical protein
MANFVSLLFVKKMEVLKQYYKVKGKQRRALTTRITFTKKDLFQEDPWKQAQDEIGPLHFNRPDETFF